MTKRGLRLQKTVFEARKKDGTWPKRIRKPSYGYKNVRKVSVYPQQPPSAIPYTSRSSEQKAIITTTRALPASSNKLKHALKGSHNLIIDSQESISAINITAVRRGMPPLNDNFVEEMGEFFCRDDVLVCSPRIRDIGWWRKTQKL